MAIWTKRITLISTALFLSGIYFKYSGKIIFSINGLPEEVVLSFNKILETLFMLLCIFFIFLISIRIDKGWKKIVSNLFTFLGNVIFLEDDGEIKNDRDKRNLERLDFISRLVIGVLGFTIGWQIVKLIPIPIVRGHEDFSFFIRFLIISYFFPVLGGGISLAGLCLKEFIQKIPLSN